MKKSTTLNCVECVAVQRELAIRKARKSFWLFCQLPCPKFYKDDWLYLKDLRHTLQDFYEDKIDKKILVINMPSRRGKTFTAQLFVSWMLGQSPKTKIVTGPYNQILSPPSAQQTRDEIVVENEDVKAEYSKDIFPEVQIKYGDAAKGLRSLDGSEEKDYLATSLGGTSIGIGASYVIVDNIIKTVEGAHNECVLDSHWEWYNNTLVQRMEQLRKQILIMTRWSSNDLIGKMSTRQKDNVHQICYKVVQEDGSMLCNEIMTRDECLDVVQEMDADITEANHQQEPTDQKGRLYQKFLTYDTLSDSIIKIWNYTDIVDKSVDYSVSLVFAETSGHDAYIIDVMYTKEPTETTEIARANMTIRNRADKVRIEGNNGRCGLRRNSERITKERDYRGAVFEDFHQSDNKLSGMLANSTWVENHVHYPSDWVTHWPDFYEAMVSYQRGGKNAHDDAPDAVIGIAETIIEADDFEFIAY